MHDLFAEIMAHVQSAMRFKWVAILLAWPICLAGWLYISKMPDNYEAAARVHVDTDSVLKPLLHGLAIHPDLDQQVRLMTKLMFSRPNLEKVARMTDLDLRAKDEQGMDNLVEELGENMKIVGEKNNLFTITAESDNPDTAKRTVQALLTIFVEETLGESRKKTSAAHRFLDKEIKEYEQRLQKAERNREDFKRKNHGLLPQQGHDLYSTLEETTLALENARLALQEAVNRRAAMHRQLKGQPGFTKEMSPLEQRIQALTEQKDQLLLRYTEKHPSVQAINDTIRQMEAQKDSTVGGPGTQAFGSTINPIYLEMKKALVEADSAAASLQARVDAYENRIQRLKDEMDKRLKVETELYNLNRDYKITKANYDELVGRREQAQLSENIEQNTDTVKFRIVDPPRVPEQPSGPNRVLLSSLLLLGAILAAVGVALLLSLLKPSFFSAQKVREISGLPVLGSVSMSQTPELIKKERYDFAGFIAACICLLVVFAVVVTLEALGLNLHSFLTV